MHVDERNRYLEGLRARHAKFLADRLVSPAAREEWRANVRATWDELLTKRVSDLVSPEMVADGIEAWLERSAVDGSLKPLAKAAVSAATKVSREDEAVAGSYVPAELRARLDALLERPGLVRPELVREVLDSDAAEEVMRDVLFETLKEFSEKVNPVVAEWGLPAVLKKLTPFGLGGAGKMLEAVKLELDKRTEPEIRRFLQVFSRRALRAAAELTIAKADAPASIALRKHVVAFLLARPVKELSAPAGAETADLAEDLAIDVLFALAQHPTLKKQRRAIIEGAVRKRSGMTLAEALRELGVTTTPDLDAITRATWEPLTAILATDVVRAYLAKILDEFYDRELARDDDDAG